MLVACHTEAYLGAVRGAYVVRYVVHNAPVTASVAGPDKAQLAADAPWWFETCTPLNKWRSLHGSKGKVTPLYFTARVGGPGESQSVGFALFVFS